MSHFKREAKVKSSPIAKISETSLNRRVVAFAAKSTPWAAVVVGLVAFLLLAFGLSEAFTGLPFTPWVAQEHAKPAQRFQTAQHTKQKQTKPTTTLMADGAQAVANTDASGVKIADRFAFAQDLLTAAGSLSFLFIIFQLAQSALKDYRDSPLAAVQGILISTGEKFRAEDLDQFNVTVSMVITNVGARVCALRSVAVAVERRPTPDERRYSRNGTHPIQPGSSASVQLTGNYRALLDKLPTKFSLKNGHPDLHILLEVIDPLVNQHFTQEIILSAREAIDEFRSLHKLESDEGATEYLRITDLNIADPTEVSSIQKVGVTSQRETAETKTAVDSQ